MNQVQAEVGLQNKFMTYIEGLTNAILQTHGVEARHIETAHVVEIFMAGFAWEGDVEVFQVTMSKLGCNTTIHCICYSPSICSADARRYRLSIGDCRF